MLRPIVSSIEFGNSEGIGTKSVGVPTFLFYEKTKP